jgi:hypothetical protein
MIDEEKRSTKGAEDELASVHEVDRIKKLISSIKKLPNKSAESEVSISYDEIKLNIDYLVDFYVAKLTTKAAPSVSKEEILEEFTSLLDGPSLPSNEENIHIPIILCDEDKLNIKNLFTLLENEINSGKSKKKLSELPLSKDKIIDGADLTKIFEELSDKAIEEQENPTQQLELTDIPYPSYFRVLFALIIDCIIVISLSVYIFNSFGTNTLNLEILVSQLMDSYSSFAGILFISWMLIQLISLIINQATAGQSFLKIIVADDHNRTPKISKLILRLTLHLFNFLSFTGYSNIYIRWRYPEEYRKFYCPISKTKLTFKGFTE